MGEAEGEDVGAVKVADGGDDDAAGFDNLPTSRCGHVQDISTFTMEPVHLRVNIYAVWD